MASIGPWKLAIAWSLPTLACVCALVFAAYEIPNELKEMREAGVRADQNLAACLDFAQTDEHRASCETSHAADVTIAQTERATARRHIIVDAIVFGLAALCFAFYFAFVPRKWRGGFRTWIFVIATAVIFGGGYFWMALRAVSKTD